VATGVLSVTAPLSGYAGTLYSVDTVQRTKTITIRDWTQESGVNQNIQVFANEQFDSLKDVVVEGSISYLGLATPYLAPGYSISITGNGYTTGWETLQSALTSAGNSMPPGLPISQSQVNFKWNASGTSYVTTLSLSNRKQRYSSEVFVRPAERGQMLGGRPFGVGYGSGWASAAGALQDFGQAAAAGMTPGEGQLGDLSAAEGGSAGFRGVTIDDTNRQLQRQRRDERLEKQLNAQRTREGRNQAGPPAPTEYPFAEVNPPTPDAADLAQAERRKRAAEHTSEGSYNEARYGSEESLGLIADESHP